MTPRRSVFDELYLLLWNVHRGNNAARVLDRLDTEIKKRRPQVIVLNEAMQLWADLARWAARNGYRIYHQKPQPRRRGRAYPAEGDVALLVDGRDEDLELRRHRRVRMRKAWKVFSHNQPREPRIYERVWIKDPGGRWKVTGSHWPTNGFTGGNRVAFAESAIRAAGSLVLRLLGTVGLDLGDHNVAVRLLRAWARRALGRGAVVDGHGPDSVIAVGATVDVEVGPEDGSDHNLLRITATRRRPRWFRRRSKAAR